MKKCLCILLAILLLPLSALAQSGGVLEDAKKPDYESALQELRSANLGDIERLEAVRDKLKGVGIHLSSVQYRLFVEVLLVLAREEEEQFDKALENVLGLGNSVKFVKEYSQQPNFPDLLDLTEYIRARMLEANKDYSGAIKIYRKYPEVLDALIRASDLADKMTPTPKPTPTPTLAPPLPPPASVTVSVTPRAAIIRWNTVSDAKEYRVYRVDTAGGNPVPIATVTGTEHRDATVEAGHTYRYQVAAVSGTQASGLTAFAEAVMPTSTPRLMPIATPVPTLIPTIKPTPQPTPTKKPDSVGSIVIFGKYEQDNNKSNGPEPIQWRVLMEEGDKALLISEMSLDCKPFHTNPEIATWSSCSLRRWLNGDFLSTAFSVKEQMVILTTHLTGERYDRDTDDRVFLLNIIEAETLFENDTDRRAQNTAYSKKRGAYDDRGYSWWWLRSEGIYYQAANVMSNGSIDSNGINVNNPGNAVRPALYIELSSGIF